MNRWEWVYHKSEAISRAVRTCWDENDQRIRSWDENRITGDVLRSIGTSGTVKWGENTCKASWRMFQAFGDYENLNGDIALDVVLSSQQGDVLVGVKHFEAKAADPSTKKYKAIRADQFKRMAGSVGHEVLLYSLWSPFEGYCWPPWAHIGAGSLPTELALGLASEGYIDLNANAFPFAHVLAEAFCGRGLDTDKQRVADFQSELNKVDARYVDAATPLDLPQLPSFFMQVRAAIGEGLELRQNFEPPKGYFPLPEVVSDNDGPSDNARPRNR